MKIVFVASTIRNSLCIIYGFFYYFFQKSLFTVTYFLIAVINLTTWGPLYTCLVSFILSSHNTKANKGFKLPDVFLSDSGRILKELIFQLPELGQNSTYFGYLNDFSGY